MDSWHATFLGLRHLPRELTAFEVEVFFQFSAEEARIIEERRRPELKLGLALQMGFLRMSGRLLDAVRMGPPLLWRHCAIWRRRSGLGVVEVAALLALRRALRNGIVWIDHSLAFRSRERLYIPTEIWEKDRNAYYGLTSE